MPSPTPEHQANPQCLLDALVEHVQTRLRGRIHGFRVELRDGGLVLAGCTKTYYAKQLVQHHVMEMTDLPIMANGIEVR